MQTLISQYLSQNKYESSYFDEFKENYLSHPDYPSLYAVTDSLELTDNDCPVSTERCTNSCGGFNDTTPKSYYGKCSGGYPPKPNPGFGLIG